MKILILDVDEAHNKRVRLALGEIPNTQITFFNHLDEVLEILNGNPQADVKKKDLEKSLAESSAVLQKMKDTIASAEEKKKTKMKDNLALKPGGDKALLAQKNALEKEINGMTSQISKAVELKTKMEELCFKKQTDLAEHQKSVLPEENKKIDLILVDRSFLGSKPEAWLKDLRSKIILADNQNVPVVTMGYNESLSYIRAFILAGVSDYFIKPVDILLLKNKASKIAKGEVEANDKVYELKTKTQINLLQQINIQKMSEFEMEVVSLHKFSEKECVELVADAFGVNSAGHLLATCLKSTPDPSGQGSYVTLFSFVGLLPQTMNELRKWLKRQYIEQKQKENS